MVDTTGVYRTSVEEFTSIQPTTTLLLALPSRGNSTITELSYIRSLLFLPLHMIPDGLVEMHLDVYTKVSKSLNEIFEEHHSKINIQAFNFVFADLFLEPRSVHIEENLTISSSSLYAKTVRDIFRVFIRF